MMQKFQFIVLIHIIVNIRIEKYLFLEISQNLEYFLNVKYVSFCNLAHL